MSAANGRNPMRWKCSERGCFNEKRRPKIEEFADCLPGRIAFTDVDATVEVNGRFLFIEFKGGEPRDIPVGQRIYLERLTRLSPRIWAIIACADAETMVTTHVRVVHNGIFSPWEETNLYDLKRRISSWARRAQAMSPLRLARAA
jgi:hypothetical protein